MKKLIFIPLLLSNLLFAYSSNVVNGYAVAMLDHRMVEENVQAKRKTDKDYNGYCFSKVYIFGKLFHEKPKVTIGNSQGHIIKERSIIKNGKIVGKEYIFQHMTVTKGYLKLKYSGKILDSKVFVK